MDTRADAERLPLEVLPEQAQAIAAALRPFKGHKVRLFSTPPTDETVRLAESLANVMQSAGLNPQHFRVGSLVLESGKSPERGITIYFGKHQIAISNALVTVLVTQKVVDPERSIRLIPSNEPDRFIVCLSPTS